MSCIIHSAGRVIKLSLGPQCPHSFDRPAISSFIRSAGRVLIHSFSRPGFHSFVYSAVPSKLFIRGRRWNHAGPGPAVVACICAMSTGCVCAHGRAWDEQERSLREREKERAGARVSREVQSKGEDSEMESRRLGSAPRSVRLRRCWILRSTSAMSRPRLASVRSFSESVP